ncbi:DUF402 domain-containing protein [Micromonospora sp. CPCC 206061]|uniref:DUF402 domain-containing protein n=1 Tax=Micromonospora sp. CPCC 206061 TaxID=3122410 RepID=UPI002FEEE323
MSLKVGSVVLRRQFEHDELSRVWVGRVAADDERGLLIWIADGSPARDVIAADGRLFHEVPFEDWGRIPKKLAEMRWAGDALMLHPPGERYSLWWFFGEDCDFRGWYVNLEYPAVRWVDGDLAGIDTVDHDIDIVVRPDRSWEYKDEEQFARHMRYSHYWVDDETAVRAAGARAIELVESGAFPFDGSWCKFRPDPLWTVPVDLPAGWDRERAQ